MTTHTLTTIRGTSVTKTSLPCGDDEGGIQCGFCQVQKRAGRLATTGETWLYVFDVEANEDVKKEAGESDEPTIKPKECFQCGNVLGAWHMEQCYLGNQSRTVREQDTVPPF